MKIIQEALQWGTAQLSTSRSPALDTEVLLAYVLNTDRLHLMAHPEQRLSWFQTWSYKRLIKQAARGKPVAYLIGHKEFYGLDFEVDSRVLIPRPDTEELVEQASNVIRQLQKECDATTLVDVGTGTGCIAISLLSRIPGLFAVGLDISPGALAVARKNRRRHGLNTRFRLMRSDLLKALDAEKFAGKCLVMTANLPYLPDHWAQGRPIAQGGLSGSRQKEPSRDEFENEEAFLLYKKFAQQDKWNRDSTTLYEPDMALFGGKDGFELYKKFIQESKRFCPKAIILEAFDFQAAGLASLLPAYTLHTHGLGGRAVCAVFLAA